MHQKLLHGICHSAGVSVFFFLSLCKGEHDKTFYFTTTITEFKLIQSLVIKMLCNQITTDFLLCTS